MPEPHFIEGLSHAHGTGMTGDQMRAVDAERRRIDASHLARRVSAVADRPGQARSRAEPVQESPNASAFSTATTSTSSGPQTGDAASPRGPRVIEVGKALQAQAERAWHRAELDRIEGALNRALAERPFVGRSK